MKRLIKDIKNFEGNVVCIGVNDNKIMNVLNKNSSINLYELSRQVSRNILSKRKRLKTNNGKSIKIKKFRKIFKKKSVDYLVINMDDIIDYKKFIASNSVYICKNKIYVYGTLEYASISTINRYFKRYSKNIEKIKVDDEYLFIIDVKDSKYSFVKEKFYIFIDTLYNIGDMVSYFLTS